MRCYRNSSRSDWRDKILSLGADLTAKVPDEMAETQPIVAGLAFPPFPPSLLYLRRLGSLLTRLLLLLLLSILNGLISEDGLSGFEQVILRCLRRLQRHRR